MFPVFLESQGFLEFRAFQASPEFLESQGFLEFQEFRASPEFQESLAFRASDSPASLALPAPPASMSAQSSDFPSPSSAALSHLSPG